MTSTKNPGHPEDPSATPGPPGATPATVHVLRYGGATYELRLICCNKPNCSKCNHDGRMRPTHGPYWYLCFTSHGRTCRVYMGKNLDTSLYRDEHGHISIAAIRAARGKKQPAAVAHIEDPDQADSAEAAAAAVILGDTPHKPHDAKEAQNPEDPRTDRPQSFRQKVASWISGPEKSTRHT